MFTICKPPNFRQPLKKETSVTFLAWLILRGEKTPKPISFILPLRSLRRCGARDKIFATLTRIYWPSHLIWNNFCFFDYTPLHESQYFFNFWQSKFMQNCPLLSCLEPIFCLALVDFWSPVLPNANSTSKLLLFRITFQILGACIW